MKRTAYTSLSEVVLITACLGLISAQLQAGDWPQWRGPNRDAKAAGFKAPQTWPEELTQQWRVQVGPGDASPALTPSAQLIVFEPSDQEYNKLASYKVSENEIYAYPVPAGNGIYIKDQNSLTLWRCQ